MAILCLAMVMHIFEATLLVEHYPVMIFCHIFSDSLLCTSNHID